jgi:hypothetical protein
VYHPDLRQEIEFLKARLLYKTKKLDEAVLNTGDSERIETLKEQILLIETKLQICREESKAQDETQRKDEQDFFNEKD